MGFTRFDIEEFDLSAEYGLAISWEEQLRVSREGSGHISMGASPAQIVRKVLFPEAVPDLLRGVTLMLVNLVGYSAMAGAVGGGGLGDLAIRFGHQRFRPDIMLATIVVMIVMVQAIQTAGDWTVRAVLRRRGMEG